MNKKVKEEAKREAQKRYELIKQGKAQPQGSEKGYLNLRPLTERSKEEQLAIRRKAQKRQREVMKIQKTAKESMTELLSVVAKEVAKERIDEEILAKAKQINPNLTLYDIVNLKMIERATDGSVTASVYVRDTVGDKPTDKLDVTAQSLTEEDRTLLEQVQKRLEDNQNIVDVC